MKKISEYDDLGLQHKERLPDPIERVPEPVMGVILKALAKNPGDRYAMAGDFVKAFETALKEKVRPECPVCEERSNEEVRRKAADEAVRRHKAEKRLVKKKSRRDLYGAIATLIVVAAVAAGLLVYSSMEEGRRRERIEAQARLAEEKRKAEEVQAKLAAAEKKTEAERKAEATRLAEERRRAEEERKRTETEQAKKKAPSGLIKMVPIQAGTFRLGSHSGESGRYRDEGPENQVTISRDFYMGVTEVTQGQWKNVMGSNPSYFSRCGDDCPVEQVSWHDSVKFCNKLSEREGLKPAYRISGESVTWDKSADGYRLPTEAEWEYACRAGSKTRYSWGDEDPVCEPGRKNGARFDDNQKCDDIGPAPVKTYSSNAWGLYDMHGNVWEWCWDWYGGYPSNPLTDPAGAAWSSTRIFRGGSWDYYAGFCRSACRYSDVPGTRDIYIGLRLLRPINP